MGPILGRTKRLLSQFPAELLIMIAKCLLCQPCETYSATTLHKSGHYECLQPLTLVSKSFRHACIAAGFFNRIQPHPSHPDFYHILLHSTRLSSLTVDIGEPQLWRACANIMKMFPKLEELGLTGSATQKSAKQLCNSSLGKAFQQFAGSSLVLKKAHFIDPTLRILLKIHRANVTKLCLNQCELQVTLDENELQTIVKRQNGRGTPLCPNAQVISFVYSGDSDPLQLKPQTIVGFVNLFLKYAKNIQHVGVTYGFRPRLFNDREILWGNMRRQLEEILWRTNWSYNLSRKYILSALRQYSRNSLVSFTEYDGLNGPFMEDMDWWFEPHRGPFQTTLPPFTAIKLLSFRCHDLNLLTSYDGIDDCTAGYRWHLPDKTAEFRREEQYHSIWIHVNFLHLQFN
jgi:hypothetical protein